MGDLNRRLDKLEELLTGASRRRLARARWLLEYRGTDPDLLRRQARLRELATVARARRLASEGGGAGA
jgi:hypothetical protein